MDNDLRARGRYWLDWFLTDRLSLPMVPDEMLSKAARNEGLKMRAMLLNNLAVAFIVVCLLTPFVGTIYGRLGRPSLAKEVLIVILIGLFAATALLLHRAALRMVQRIED